MEDKLISTLDQSNLDKDNAKKLLEAFGMPLEEAGKILSGYKDILVTDESQTDLMAEARTKRLKLKEIRVSVEKRRKELKEDSIRTGRAIDSVANIVKLEIEPAEKYLQLQEDFAKIKLAERNAKIKAERIEKLMKYTDDVSVYNLDEMQEEQFQSLLNTLIENHESKIAEAKRVEQERIAKEKEYAEEQEKIRKENERLRAEAERKEKEEKAAREKNEAEAHKKAQAESLENKRIFDIKVKILNFSHNIKTIIEADKSLFDLENFKNTLDVNDFENEVLNAAYHKAKSEIIEAKQYIKEQNDKAEADRVKLEEAKIQAEKDEAERKELLAPDKEKLIKFADGIETIRSTRLPAVKNNESQLIVNKINIRLSELVKFVKESSKKL